MNRSTLICISSERGCVVLDQPQRVESRKALGQFKASVFANELRLVFDTAALHLDLATTA